MNLPQTLATGFSAVVKLFLLAVFLTATVQAQSGSVDLSFNTVVSKDIDAGNFTLQPDGKIIVFGNFQIVNGALKNQIARLNADGSLDNSFDCAACDFQINSAMVQPDGKIIVGGTFYFNATQTSIARVKRLNTDGSVDNSFVSPFAETNAPGNTFARVRAIQPDGKVLIEISTSALGNTYIEIARLNADGKFDDTFTRISFQTGRTSPIYITKVMLQADGKILVSTYNGGFQSFGILKRFNSDGTVDTNFEVPSLAGSSATPISSTYIFDFDIQTDGKIIVGGRFETVNGVSRPNLVRLMPAGNVDLSFVPPNVYVTGEPITRLKVLANGQILASTGTAIDGAGSFRGGNRFFHFNPDGSLDNTFASPANLVSIVNWEVDVSGKIVLYGGFLENGTTVLKFARLNTNGSVSEYLNAYFGIVGSVKTLAIQPDGKILFAGDFSRVNGVPRRDIARVNADGTTDSSFNPAIKIDAPITKIVVQPDGKILLGGSFTVNNSSGLGIVRLFSDGSLDTTFNPNLPTSVYSIALQTDGKILVGGSFIKVNAQSPVGLARLNADGTIDTSFNPLFASNSSIRSIVFQADGKILVGGTFNGVGGFARQNLARLNSDGSVDASFNAGNISPVNQVEILIDGMYLVLTNTIVRLNSNGSADAAFQIPTINGNVKTFLVRPNGTIFIGGDITGVNGVVRNRYARLNADGTLDTTFAPVSGADGTVNDILLQPDGKILLGGNFTQINNVFTPGIARLLEQSVKSRKRVRFF